MTPKHMETLEGLVHDITVYLLLISASECTLNLLTQTQILLSLLEIGCRLVLIILGEYYPR